MATTDGLSRNPPLAPKRVYYSTGRMLGADDFQADQDYHRGRLARALTQLFGSGTVSGLLVQTDGNSDLTKLKVQVTPGIAIDRAGRIIEVPVQVCIVLNEWLQQTVNAWKAQVDNPTPGQTALPDPNDAIQDGSHLIVDVFATFVPCTRGLTPNFAAEDDYDATDSFAANRWLDSFAMQLVLRTDANPLTPVDPWKAGGALAAGGSKLAAPNAVDVRTLLMAGTSGPATPPVEYPPTFDTSSVFLARIQIAAAKGATGQIPTWDLNHVVINNDLRLFVYPAALMARFGGLGSGTET